MSSAPRRPGYEAVLFDKDGTLVLDVPYCADPRLVQVMPTAPAALAMVRAAGIPIGIVSNQSGIGRGLISPDAAAAVFDEVERLLGPFDTVRYCPHAPEDGCRCRKPRPGMLLDAAEELGVAPERMAVVGDIGADVDAALAIGAAAVLVPTAVTRPEEIRRAPVVRPDLVSAVEYLLHGAADPVRAAG
ncbi:D-glycero-alpha-D-manno-heptose-1,7-bisphosphate 7-phosphatase [Pseudonocardia humida]|uniref:D,D-heptose 1,7-bisphosphate phosphatase n=1 Tax=Pseudonocardia humida TaxID=2800819 RepID=A0ABT0ZV08_9PSEU|nr:HAD-IIIA family hydrolase [Pseudonocardia humida]MCO1654561.1 HAD-IIIA family hydrolase [Pseudonocardia humida]